MSLDEISRAQIATEHRVDARRDRLALPEGYIGSDEETSPWIPFVENVWIRHLTFDVRNSTAVNILRVDAGGSLGRHRHRGPVLGFTIEGSWRYLEYDWVSHPGDFVRESPGRTHTLVSDEGMRTLFWLNGPLEFLDDSERVTDTIDVFWFIDHYEAYCEAQGLATNPRLYL